MSCYWWAHALRVPVRVTCETFSLTSIYAHVYLKAIEWHLTYSHHYQVFFPSEVLSVCKCLACSFDYIQVCILQIQLCSITCLFLFLIASEFSVSSSKFPVSFVCLPPWNKTPLSTDYLHTSKTLPIPTLSKDELNYDWWRYHLAVNEADCKPSVPNCCFLGHEK